MTVGLVAVMWVASALVAIGALAAVWRRDLGAALASIPLIFGGAAVAFAAVARFAAAGGPPILGQAVAVLIAAAALALVALGVGIAGRETTR